MAAIFLWFCAVLACFPYDDWQSFGQFESDCQVQHQKDIQTKYFYRPRLDKLSMFVKKIGCPRFRGRAADIMGLYNTMLELWKTHMSEANLQHRQIRLILTLNKQNADTLEE